MIEIRKYRIYPTEKQERALAEQLASPFCEAGTVPGGG